MQRLWLLFAQVATVCLALWLIVSTLKPEWLTQAPFPGRDVRIISSTVPIQEAPVTTAAPGSYRIAARRAMPSVVNIFTTKEVRQVKNPLFDDPLFRHFFAPKQNLLPEKQSSLGSGVIVSTQGYILTNNHVVDAADEIDVVLPDGRKAIASVVGTDPDTDLAVIKINLPDLPAITLGHMEQTGVGDVVLAIGNPFGVGQTVTVGIISALGRNHLDINTFENFIQTDAAINPGNSGGALIDTNGNLLGINSAIYSRSGGSLGIGFAIPVNTVKSVMESIITHGRVIRGWIGVEPQEITPELAESFGLKQNTGALIAGVVRNGPSDRAGIKPGDILTAVEGTRVNDKTAMMNLIAQLTPNKKAQLTILRKGRESTVDVLIAARQKPAPQMDEDQ